MIRSWDKVVRDPYLVSQSPSLTPVARRRTACTWRWRWPGLQRSGRCRWWGRRAGWAPARWSWAGRCSPLWRARRRTAASWSRRSDGRAARLPGDTAGQRAPPASLCTWDTRGDKWSGSGVIYEQNISLLCKTRSGVFTLHQLLHDAVWLITYSPLNWPHCYSARAWGNSCQSDRWG